MPEIPRGCWHFCVETDSPQADVWGLCPQGMHSHGLLCGAAGPRGVLLTSEERFLIKERKTCPGSKL